MAGVAQAALRDRGGARLALRPLREQARWLDLSVPSAQRGEQSAVVLAGTGPG
jgi:hypothetical protein